MRIHSLENRVVEGVELKKFFLSVSICYFSIGGICCGMSDHPLMDSLPNQNITGTHKIDDREGTNSCRFGLYSEVTRKNTKKLVESLSRIALGTITIMGTALVGVGFFQAFCKAKAQTDLEWSFLDNIGKRNWKEAISFDKVFSWTVATIFSRYYFVPGSVSLFHNGKSFILGGYKFGKIQIRRGIQDLQNLRVTLNISERNASAQ